MGSHSLQSLIDRLLLRSELSSKEQEVLSALPVEAITVRRNRDLVALGEETEASYLVKSGVIGRFSQIRAGVRQIVAVHIAGEMADLCSVALPKTSWAFHALAPTEVLRIAHSDLRKIADEHPRIAIAFWRDCVVDMAVMSEWIVSIGRRSAEAKLAHLLCELRCRYKQASLLSVDGFYPFTATQVQIADVLGITSIHVNRMIRSLRDRRLATVNRSGIIIHDYHGLADLAEFDPSYLHLHEQTLDPMAMRDPA